MLSLYYSIIQLVFRCALIKLGFYTKVVFPRVALFTVPPSLWKNERVPWETFYNICPSYDVLCDLNAGAVRRY